jgi:hypothetical protein
VVSPLCTGDSIANFKVDDYVKNLTVDRLDAGQIQEPFENFMVTTEAKGSGEFRKLLVVATPES